MISGPGIAKGATVDNMIYMQSVYPTTCELAGLKVPESVDYPSIAPLVKGEGKGGEEVIFNAYIETQRLVRTDRYKLVHYPKIGRNQLFDLKEDPHETKDLIKDPKLEKVKQRLLATLRKKRMELGDGMLDPKPGK